MTFLSISLQPYDDNAALALCRQSQIAFANTPSDVWRLNEWPFSSTQAALQEAAQLTIQTLGPQMPCAFSIMDGDAVIGLIAVTHVNDRNQNGLLGTYITPNRRGQGLQKIAKEYLFEHLPATFETLFCIIATSNTSSMRSIVKISKAQVVDQARFHELPTVIRLEIWRAGTPVNVYRIDL